MTHDRLVTDLRTLGLVAGDHVLIHSSLSRIGNVSGGPKTVINAVLDVLGSTGTAVFPAHTGTADISPANPPVFDVRFSATRGVGLVAETARHDPRGIRSLQPTHSVTAIGRLAEWLVEGHERCDTPCGTGSPYQKLAQVNGKILLIGCNHQANSTMHMLEEMCAVPYHLLPGVGMMRITDRNGDTRCLQGRFHRWGVPRDFMRADAELTRDGIQRVGTIGMAASRLVDADAMCRRLFARLNRDPYFMLPKDYSLPFAFNDAIHAS